MKKENPTQEELIEFRTQLFIDSIEKALPEQIKRLEGIVEYNEEKNTYDLNLQITDSMCADALEEYYIIKNKQDE